MPFYLKKKKLKQRISGQYKECTHIDFKYNKTLKDI